ncbi:MAG: ComF family protein [Selenomonas sp.]|nr:ComF family protein [Selenomonas sp.]
MPKLNEMSRDILGSFWDFLFPSRCPMCGRYVAERSGWCPSCLQKALTVRTLALPPGSPFEEIWALSFYKEYLQKLIKDLKYRRKMSTLPYIKSLLQGSEQELAWLVGSDFWAVPVPLFADKEKARGFNQTEKIFGEWLQEKGISTVRGLIRNRETMAMYGLSPAEREENLRGAFSAVEEAGVPLVQGRKILLLDDIFTTGSTMEACGRILKEAGAERIVGLVLASDH